MPYVDGALLPVPTANKQAYLAMAKQMADIFKKHGALSVVECWGDDIPPGELTSMPLAVKLEQDETVVLSWIMWPSKEARDAGMAKAMQDPEMAGQNPPFDGKRMIFGGFELLLDN